MMAHLCAHLPGVIGLVLNMAGSILLLWSTPPAAEYTAAGLRLKGVPWETPTEEELLRGRRHHRRMKLTFRLAVLLLLIGFTLQLIDLLRT
jgi:hypothetical protein